MNSIFCLIYSYNRNNYDVFTGTGTIEMGEEVAPSIVFSRRGLTDSYSIHL